MLRQGYLESFLGGVGRSDLAIAARVSEMFGGAARLVVDAARGSTIVLDWPARFAST